MDDVTAEQIVRELVSECSEQEQLRLLAWANLPRFEEFEGKRIKRSSRNEIGPGDQDKAVFTHAVGVGRL